MRKQRLARIVCVILQLISTNEAAKILAVFPSPSISHQVVFRPLINGLLERGHEVVTITADPQFPEGGAPENLTEIDTHDVSYTEWREMMTTLSRGDTSNSYKLATAISHAMLQVFSDQVQMRQVKENVFNKNDTFDLILAEAWFRPSLAFSHIIKAPVILVSSFGPYYDNLNVIGAVNHPLIYPEDWHHHVYELTFWKKLCNLYHTYRFMKVYYDFEERENEALRKIFGDDMPPLSELHNNVDMLFMNMHPIWDGNRPVPPGVVYMGGLHQKPEKEMPTDLKEYLDSSVNGVIYVSFGSNVDPTLLDPKKIQAMIDAFSQMPYNVLWKWNGDVLPGKTENIRISKWLPQPDLLRHPNIKVFVTQGGLQSTDEAITAGVPLIGVPILGDQWYNVEKYVQHKIGLKIELHDLTADSLKNGVTTIISDKSYRENVQRLRTVMYDQPMSPLERAVWWTEHVLRHAGARHLRAPAANMSWPRYYDLPLALTLLAALILGIVILFVVLYSISKLILSYTSYNVKMKRS